jgi:tetratricopeptide (TPR) repeat protein
LAWLVGEKGKVRQKIKRWLLQGRKNLRRLLVACLPLVLGAAELADPLARLVDEFGQVYSRGRYADAAKVAAEILAYLQSHRGPLDLDLAANLNNLGSLAYAQGKLDLAEPFYRKALEIYEKVLGSEDSNVGSVLYNLAGLSAERGNLDEALALYQRCLAVRQGAAGTDHPLVAETLNNIGFVHLSRGEEQGAESALGKALEIWQKQAGAEAPYGAITLNNLARIKVRQRRFAEAESYFEQARRIEEQIFGKEHPETAITLLNLADLHRAAGNTEKAIGTTGQALAILEKTLGPDDPLTAQTQRRFHELRGREKPDPETTGDKRGYGRYQILVVRQQPEGRELLARLRNGEPFEVLAREHSLDPSRDNGGFFEAHPADLNEAVRTQLTTLQAGEVSVPFPLGRHWAIVKKVRDPEAVQAERKQ